jgi:metal-responsive CopG/Arc/MetJ family transcriptional regulator
MQRVMLTLPADLLNEVNSLAQRTKRKRSQLVRLSLLAKGYQAQAAQIEQAAADAGLAQAHAAGALWTWERDWLAPPSCRRK